MHSGKPSLGYQIIIIIIIINRL